LFARRKFAAVDESECTWIRRRRNRMVMCKKINCRYYSNCKSYRLQMMKMSEENVRVEDDAMKISELGGSMSEFFELKMDELIVLKKDEDEEYVVDIENYRSLGGRRHVAEEC
jgi:hypothetical protein